MSELHRPHLAAFQLDLLARRITTATRTVQKQVCKQVGKPACAELFGTLFAQCDQVTCSLAKTAADLLAPGNDTQTDQTGGEALPAEPWPTYAEALAQEMSGSCSVASASSSTSAEECPLAASTEASDRTAHATTGG